TSSSVMRPPRGDEMRVLSLATVFPSPIFPNHGLFVYHRLKHLAALADVRVVAPIGIYNRGGADARKPGENAGGDPTLPALRGSEVLHPSYVYVPRFLKWTDAYALAASVFR